jgi:hypothetical protein
MYSKATRNVKVKNEPIVLHIGKYTTSLPAQKVPTQQHVGLHNTATNKLHIQGDIDAALPCRQA